MNSGQKCSRLLIRRSSKLASCPAKPVCLHYYSTATAPITDPHPPNPAIDAQLVPAASHRIFSSVVISRPPVITRDIGEFEASYYFYQRRLNDRLQLPFTRWFYFKKGTLADDEWKRKQKAANKYNAYGPRQWADELLVGDNSHKSEDNGYQYLVDTTVTGEEGLLAAMAAKAEAAKEAEAKGEAVEYSTEIITKPFPRETKADLENDTKSLDRKLSRTLYLLVKKRRQPKSWAFPQSLLVGKENLVEGAERTLRDAAGVNMHTWFVGNVPIGHHVYPTDTEAVKKKVFFMKARIMAGQVDLTGNTMDLDDFQWLTKQEIEKVVGPTYFEVVRHILVAR